MDEDLRRVRADMLEAAYNAYLYHSWEGWDEGEVGAKEVLTKVVEAALAANNEKEPTEPERTPSI